MSLIGRSQRVSAAAKRVHPSLRVRQSRFQDKNYKGARSVPRFKTSGNFLSSMTPGGWILVVSASAVLIFAIWFFVFSTIFLIKNVEVAHSAGLTEQQIQETFFKLQDQRVLFFIPGNHSAVLGRGRLEKTLKEEYPYIEGVTDFGKSWPDSAVFSVAVRKPTFILQTDAGKRFLVDAKGVVLGEAQGELADGLVILEGEIGEVGFGRPLTPTPLLKLALDFQSHWPTDKEFFPYKYSLVNTIASGELNIYTSEEWYMKVDGDDRAEEILRSLYLVLDNEIRTDARRQQLSYIDLRLPARVFYCMRGQACAR